ncbi:MAG: hypothetical protein QGG54_16815, partial [Gammaproteobacteria bacterium]|nr:hypothetical protein [Gammaproteobacteria bacterium]
MKSPVPIAAIGSTETYTGFPSIKTGDAGRVSTNTFLDAAVYDALEQYAAASGVDLQPVLKGGQGIFSYVDIGKAGGGDSIVTLTGLSLKEIFGAEAKDPDSMVMIASAGGRAFYTDATDTGKIWYSEIGRWGTVSNLNVLNFEDAGAPTAIKSTSGLLAIFFQDRMAVIDTRSGLDTGWSLAGEYSGVGCYHENLVTEFRGAFFWVGSGAVWQWQPGGAPQKISMQIEYPGMANDFATVFAGGNGWIAADPRLSDIVFMLPAETDISGNYSYLALESYAGEDSATYGTSRKVLVYKPEQKIWLSETLRRHYNRNTSAYAPQANRPPIVLDGRLLIPVHAVCKYFLVRQAYGEMEEVLAGCPRWKMPILETGFLSMGNFSVAK